MREHVAVGVPGKPTVVLDPNAAEDEWHATLECVRVDADPDSEAHRQEAT
jgi:hypothetical protein